MQLFTDHCYFWFVSCLGRESRKIEGRFEVGFCPPLIVAQNESLSLLRSRGCSSTLTITVFELFEDGKVFLKFAF